MTVNPDRKLKILVVEDFRFTRRMEIAALKELGFENILEAENGEKAIARLEAEKDTGLIISDWNMPEKNGYELLRQIRSDQRFRHIPFVMVTAQAEEKERRSALEAGASHFIIKPFCAQELGEVLEKILIPTHRASAENSAPDREKQQKEKSAKIRIIAGHIQITDHLVLGVLKHLIAMEEFRPVYFELETRCMSGWNPVQNSLAKGDIDAALILAPVAMDLFASGLPIRLILFAHKNGSIFVIRKKGGTGKAFRKFFKDSIFYIPHILSVHHMLSHMFFREIGLISGLVGKKSSDVCFEVVPPAKMPTFLKKSQESSGFMVAQPLGAKAIGENIAELLFLSGEFWENHPCCAVVVHENLIQSHPEAVHEFTELLVKSGKFIQDNPQRAARIAIDFLDPEKAMKLSDPVLESVLTEVHGIRTDDLFPVIEDLDRMQRYMSEKMNIGKMTNLEKFVDIRFAKEICRKYPAEKRPSAFPDLSALCTQIRDRYYL